jgi:hypothetical protein
VKNIPRQMGRKPTGTQEVAPKGRGGTESAGIRSEEGRTGRGVGRWKGCRRSIIRTHRKVGDSPDFLVGTHRKIDRWLSEALSHNPREGGAVASRSTVKSTGARSMALLEVTLNRPLDRSWLSFSSSIDLVHQRSPTSECEIVPRHSISDMGSNS